VESERERERRRDGRARERSMGEWTRAACARRYAAARTTAR
jgi:hypothetical protein